MGGSQADGTIRLVTDGSSASKIALMTMSSLNINGYVPVSWYRRLSCLLEERVVAGSEALNSCDEI